MNDLKDAAGRGGTGAVMGSKKLKAIAVRGHKRLEVADPERLKELRQWVLAHRELWASFAEYGTGSPSLMEGGVANGNVPIRNFAHGEFPEISKITGDAVKNTIRIGMDACYGCLVRCKKVVKVDEPYSVDPAYGGPEYETLAAIGSNCCISDLKAIARGNELCNAYTLDTISTGVTISFAMECFENGLLTTKDTDGIELRFGSPEAMLKTIKLIAKREGIGDILAEGTARAARKIGRGAIEFAMQVKGVEIGMHEPRVKAALGLGYEINPHGADHCANLHDTMINKMGPDLDRFRSLGVLEPLAADDLGPRKVATFRNIHLQYIVNDSLVLCQFLPYDTEQIADILSAVTGWNIGPVEMLGIAERAITMARLFNIREGLSAADDKLPNRFFQPKKNGALSTKFYDPKQLGKAKSYYYTLMGWDAKTGIPTLEKLQELGI
jgi:aldehyde:ferredoxin oxidoreductase